MMTDREPPNRKVNVAGLSRNLVFWLLIILIPIVGYQMIEANREPTEEISYSDFQRHLNQGNVARVEVERGKLVEGDFKRPITARGREVSRFRVILPIQDSEAFIQRLEEQGIPISAREPKPGFGAVFIQLLPWMILIGLWLFFFRQMQQGGNRAFAFGKSKAKLLSGDTPKVTFQDIAGCDEAKIELQEIIEFLRDPQRFQRLGGRLPRRCLPRRWRAKPGAHSSRCRVRTSSRCSWASAPRASAISSSRGRRTRRASSSSTRSMPSGGIAARAWAGVTTSASRR
jgi:cell division protease FtsH